MELTEEQIDDMLHALGIDYIRKTGKKIKPNKRYRPMPLSFRNYYQEKDNKSWNELVKQELATCIKSENSWQCVYFVSQKGKDTLKQLGYNWKEEN